MGIKASQLAGGCACCTVQGELHAALAELATARAQGTDLDYLVS